MKKLLYTFVVTTCILALSAPAMAYELSDTKEVNYHKMWYKFKRGVINVLTSPVEIPKQIKAEVKDTEGKVGTKVIAGFGGTVKGLAYGVGRLGSGLWDCLSFNLSVPKNYEPLMKPEYVCDHKK